MNSSRRLSALLIAGGIAMAATAVAVARPAAAVVPVTYVAIGDSYSSGEGNPPFDADSAADGCDRSSKAWPRLIAAQHPGVDLVAQLACSGATSDALFNTFKTEPAQLTALQSLASPPAIVSVTIGGNDLGFASVLTNCFLFNCVNDGRVAQARTYLENTLPAVLLNDYQSIKAADPTGHAVVVGYPNLFPSGTPVNCSWLAGNEKTQLIALAGEFDATMAAQAAAAGLRYVSVLHALAGHELCTTQSWVYPIGFSGGDSRGHPIAQGQQALANSILKTLSGQ